MILDYATFGGAFRRSYVLAENTFINPHYEFMPAGWIQQYVIVLHAKYPNEQEFHCHITDDFDHLGPLWIMKFDSKGKPLIEGPGAEKLGKKFFKELNWWLKAKCWEYPGTNKEWLLEHWETFTMLPTDHRYLRKE